MILNRKEIEVHCSYFPQYIDCVIVVLLTVDVNSFFESNNLGGAASTCTVREKRNSETYFCSDVVHIVNFFIFVYANVVSQTGNTVVCLIWTGEGAIEYKRVWFSWSCTPIFQVDQTVQRDFARVWLWRRHGRTVVETRGGQGYQEQSRFPDCGMTSW